MPISHPIYFISHWSLLFLSVFVFLYACKKLPLMNTLRYSSGLMYANVILIFVLALFKVATSLKIMFVPLTGTEWVLDAFGRLSQLFLYYCLLTCLHQCGVGCEHRRPSYTPTSKLGDS